MNQTLSGPGARLGNPVDDPGRIRPSRFSKLLFPRGVRVWHFILVPGVGMAIFLLVFREIDRWALTWFMRSGYPDAYMAIRGAGIATLMSSLIAYLAIRYRTDYEAKLEARNRALASTRDFLARIIEDSAEAIITRDETGKITSWNRAAEAIYGWSAEEMLGRGAEIRPAAGRHRGEGRLRQDARPRGERGARARPPAIS